MTPQQIQTALNAAGFGPVATDGNIGPRTLNAIKMFQSKNGLMPDGRVGPKTIAALEAVSARQPATGVAIPDRDTDPVKAPAGQAKAKHWPRQNEVEAFFGKACSARATAGKVILPVALRYGDSPVRSFVCHELVAQPMLEIFKETVEHYGEARWRALRLDAFGGCYNCRPMRGGTRYSMHAWGIAIDIDPGNNQLKWGKDRASLARPEYEPFWKIVESKGAISLGRLLNFDWMHFQFARL